MLDDPEIKRLEKQREILVESIRRLGQYLDLMSIGDLRRDVLQYELQIEEEKLDKVEVDIANHRSQLLYKALMNLDYRSHTNYFQNFSRANHIGAFILHGSMNYHHDYRGYSVRALLKRLVHSIPNSMVSPLIHRDFAHALCSSDINALWRCLADVFKLGMGAQREAIIKCVCKQLKTKNVILVFLGVDYMPKENLDALIQNFWGPLAAGAYAKHSGHFQLLMFLVDYSGRVKDWEIPCIEQPDDEIWQPDMPMRLPIVTNFSDHDLEKWIEYWSEPLFDILPDDLTKGPFKDRAKNILDNSNNGDPDLVMSHICGVCDIDLVGADAACLKL